LLVRQSWETKALPTYPKHRLLRHSALPNSAILGIPAPDATVFATGGYIPGAVQPKQNRLVKQVNMASPLLFVRALAPRRQGHAELRGHGSGCARRSLQRFRNLFDA
jgi:hypothetical protein